MYFADWAYLDSTEEIKENLSTYGFTLLKHEKTKIAGFVGYYVAIDEVNKLALVGVKGTSSLEDVLTDCCAQTVTHELDSSFMDESFSLKGLFGGDKMSVMSMLGIKKEGFKEIHCHEVRIYFFCFSFISFHVGSLPLSDDFYCFFLNFSLLPSGYLNFSQTIS